MELWQRFETELEQARQAIPGGPRGWRPERLILRDWWYWRNQEFGFAHGRLALTGQNTGGKSSLLTLMVPVLLDGRTDPVRLDPAQSRDRFIYYYLLGANDADAGNLEAFRYEARTGYMALEFYHPVEERFLTIGMGLSASRTSPRRITDWWGFLLLQGQRLGRGFDVRGVNDTCLGRREFTRMLGDGGIVCEERSEYQRQVNNHLFSLEGDDYHALIEMLLQARRPKLGEQSGPDKVCDLLRRALPGVPSDRLNRVAEVVNNIEEYSRNMTDVTTKAEALGRIDTALLALADVLVQESAQQYMEIQGRLGSVAGRLKTARGSLETARQGLSLLEEQARQRGVEKAALQAEIGELRQGDGTDLQERLKNAKDLLATCKEKVGDLGLRVAEGRKAAEKVLKEQEQAGELFATKRRALADSIGRLNRDVNRLAWKDAVEQLQDATRAVDVLAITDSPDVIEGALDLPLAVGARRFKEEFHAAAAARKHLDENVRAFERVQARVDALRNTMNGLADQVEEAKDRAGDRAEDVVAFLQAWQERSLVLQPGDIDLARVVAKVREMVEPPSVGSREIVEPLVGLAGRRRRELKDRLVALEEKERAAQARADRLAQCLAEVEMDLGDPGRSDIRNKARTVLPSGLQPFFRLVRFRPDVPVEIAALVEAAILEAGWLDLLLPAEPHQVELADAYLVPEQVDGPSLLEVLEPEPGAPAVVAQALASIGWGEGNGSRWVAHDGRWRNAASHGRVAPWAETEAGYFGADNRARRKERRVAQAQAALQEACVALDAVSAERAGVTANIEALADELSQLDQFPWQPLFDSLGDVRTLEVQLARAKSQLEQEKPGLAQAEAVLRAATREFDDAVYGLPGAAGLNYEELLKREMDFALLTERIETLTAPAAELTGIACSYRLRAETIHQVQKALVDLERDEEVAHRDLSASEAAVAALERRLDDPDVQEQQKQLEQAVDQLNQLSKDEQDAFKDKVKLEGSASNAREQIGELEPQEADLRQELGRRLDRVRGRLQLHPQHLLYLEALDREGPVTVMRRLPRPAADDDYESLKMQRQGELIRIVHVEQDLLRDYRPTWNAEQNSLTFYDERLPLTTQQLRERLERRVKEYKGLMEEEQRKLFEDIIYEGILDELRRLIRQAQEFTRRTNEKLKALRLSNEEQLSLRFSILPPEQMPGAKIAYELAQMEQGSRWLEESKRDVLLSTIKEEVERVRLSANAVGEEIGYNEAVARALDYRNWYQYQLFSKMPGTSSPVPIRTRGFGRRSTSAKAWALAVPVLAAVAARYDASPKADVPRLIGLDEAFAGLDPNNQENYLGFLNQLGFCWIITAPDELPYSQSLPAAMAYRMSLEGNFHTAFPILWNGQVAWEPMAEWVWDLGVRSQT